MSGIENINPQEVFNVLKEVGPQLVAPALFGVQAYLRSRRLSKKSAMSDETSVKIAEIDQQIKAHEAKKKAHEGLIHIVRQLDDTKSIAQRSHMMAKFRTEIETAVDPAEWKKASEKARQALVDNKLNQVRQMGQGDQARDLNRQKLILRGQAGKGIVGHNLQRAKGFVTNEIKQTVEATAIGFAIDALYLPAADALMRGIDWYNGVASLADKGVVVGETVGIAVAAYYLLDRAFNVHPGK